MYVCENIRLEHGRWGKNEKHRTGGRQAPDSILTKALSMIYKQTLNSLL